MIKFDEVVSMLRESIAAMGEDHVYQRMAGETKCLYVHRVVDQDSESITLEPGCIMGDMIVRQHILTLEELSDIQENPYGANGPMYEMQDRIFERTGKTFSDKASDLMLAVQDSQDSGDDWGSALRAGLDYVSKNSYREDDESLLPSV